MTTQKNATLQKESQNALFYTAPHFKVLKYTAKQKKIKRQHYRY